jgi:hypothetical protein
VDRDANAFSIMGNQINLAIKGIIAIGAILKMSSFAGKRANADHYSVCMDMVDMVQ